MVITTTCSIIRNNLLLISPPLYTFRASICLSDAERRVRWEEKSADDRSGFFVMQHTIVVTEITGVRNFITDTLSVRMIDSW
jgi:hypothetical protein